MLAIEVKNLKKSFKKSLFSERKTVLKEISFGVPSGQTTGFVGNNGSGKTTTIKCLFQFIHPDSGEISFFGKELDSKLKRKIGYLPERPYLYEFLTGMEFLKFHWQLSTGSFSKDFYEKAHKALKMVGLYEARDKNLRNYSKGMLQRAGLAQALLHDPELIILDEPMSGLDPDGRLMVKDILKDQKKKGVSLFFSSHLLQDMEELCEQLVVIHHGDILYNGSLGSFMQKFPSLEEAFRHRREGGQ